MPPTGARTISALLTLRGHVIVPLLAGVRSPRLGSAQPIPIPTDRHYDKLRIDMEALFTDLGTPRPLARGDRLGGLSTNTTSGRAT